MGVSYAPLAPGTIRILCLDPGQVDEPLFASFDTAKIDVEDYGDRIYRVSTFTRRTMIHDAPDTPNRDEQQSSKYEAISYAWGAPVFRRQLTVRGKGTFNITESLHQALQRFRLSDDVRRLWADAVCINQKDIEERSAQVNIMAQIYAQARGVLVWLGPSQDTDTLAMATIGIMPKLKPTDLYTVNERPELPGKQEIELHDDELDRLNEQLSASPTCPCCQQRVELQGDFVALGLFAVGELMHRAWFTRLWVV